MNVIHTGGRLKRQDVEEVDDSQTDLSPEIASKLRLVPPFLPPSLPSYTAAQSRSKVAATGRTSGNRRPEHGGTAQTSVHAGVTVVLIKEGEQAAR